MLKFVFKRKLDSFISTLFGLEVEIDMITLARHWWKSTDSPGVLICVARAPPDSALWIGLSLAGDEESMFYVYRWAILCIFQIAVDFCYVRVGGIKLPMYLFFYMALGLNDFDAGNIHYKGHWKGWALKIEACLGPENGSEASSI
jgi:hypothetical protein